ncbi:CinA family protein [Parvularcula maris]|uniref:CinA family protein n=1 Tax=Parvularcula maris TaxID=2965077 RepID=A0A9X2L774_9PROT|nr:nicotinamide-nucleotide amidohydrolase family protein [Parvularcula maris]MCQ8184330.1 CinA family protein [Parvularcula maris]
MDNTALRLAEELVRQCTEEVLMVSTAESCTGGLIAAAITSVSGSSSVFGEGFVTYANEAKTRALGVPEDILVKHGAVSGEVAALMAEGAKARSGADLAVSVTGIAGPGGGSADKPVGLVWFGLATPEGVRVERRVFPQGGRDFVRILTQRQALRMLLAAV